MLYSEQRCGKEDRVKGAKGQKKKQGEGERAGEEQCKGRGKLLYLVIQVTGVEIRL